MSEAAKVESAHPHPLLYNATGDDTLVKFNGDKDTLNPQNWSFGKKIVNTALWGLTTCWIVFASAIYSSGTLQISDEFNVNITTATAGTSLLVFGFAVGPMVWGPLCELYGRKWIALAPYFISGAFAFGTATAKDMQTILITRFFAGAFGSAPISITAGAIVDIWAPSSRGNPMVCYGITIAAAPTLGPIIGNSLIARGLGWRWTEYLTGIVMMAQFAIDVVFLSESHADVLLMAKASSLRREGGNFALHAKWEETSPTVAELGRTYLIRPFKMLLDPICLLITIYASFVYSILYSGLVAFALEFQQIRRYATVVASLPFLSLLIGCLLAAAANIYNNRYFRRQFIANNYKSVPEARLPPMMIGGFALSGGLFLFGWTSLPHVASPWPSIIGICLLGFGFTTIFQASLQYLVETFTRYSASAIAANTFVRSLAGGAFPLFVGPMYNKIGVDWGSTIFACFGLLLLPAPFMFFKWGKRIRARGEWSKLSTY